MSPIIRKDRQVAKKQEQAEPTAPAKKKVRGKPFTSNDPRRNLSGRPKLGATLAARYRDALAEAESEARGGEYSKLDAMIDILVGKALEGDQRAIEYLQERGFGKVPDRLELVAEMTKAGSVDLDLSALTADEIHVFQDLYLKATGKEPETHTEHVGTKRLEFRYVIQKEYVDAPMLADVVDGTVSE